MQIVERSEVHVVEYSSTVSVAAISLPDRKGKKRQRNLPQTTGNYNLWGHSNKWFLWM